MKRLKIQFAGIDLIKKNKDWFVLEANTAAGYSYFDGPDGSIAKLLLKKLGMGTSSQSPHNILIDG